MKVTCTRHAGRAPTDPRTHLPQPTCSWRCAWQPLCTNPVLSGKRCGTAVRNQGTRAQPNPNRWPGQRNGSVDRGSDSPPAQRRRRPRPKSDSGEETTCNPQASDNKNLGQVRAPDWSAAKKKRRQRRGQGPGLGAENPSGQAVPSVSAGRSTAKSVCMSRAMQSSPTREVSYHLMPSMRRNQVYW